MGINDRFLYGFSIGFALFMALLLIIPILRRKSEVFTTWNFFLVGSLIFTGLSGLNATTQGHYLPTYRSADYSAFYVGVFVFYTTVIATYYFFKFPRKLAGRHLLAWPRLSGWTLAILTILLTGLGLYQVAPTAIPLVGQLLFQFSLATPLLACALAFIAWYRAPTNPLLIGLLVTVLGAAVFLVLGLGGSRRYLMSVLAVPPVALYWVWLRYKPTGTLITWLLVSIFIGVPVLKGFSSIRHVIRDQRHRSIVSRGVATLKALPTAVMKGGTSEGFMGQDSVEAALLTIHMLNDNSGRLEVVPFHSAIYILVNPVPRSFWPEKPRAFGTDLPIAAKLPEKGINANLGVNVVGQCYYDGGLLMHVLYAIVWGSFLRFYDELLVRQPGNPLLIGGLVFMAPQIIGFPRGGIEGMGLQVFLGFITVVLVGWLSRIVFGAGLVYPRTDHLVDYPVLRTPDDWARWMRGYAAVSAGREDYEPEDEEEGLDAA